MGDARFSKAYERVRGAPDRADAIRALTDEEVVQALAAASRERDPFLANVLATEAQNRIRRSRTITHHLAEGTFSTDERLRLTYVNPAMLELLDAEEHELIGHEIEDVLVIRDASGNRLSGTAACAMRRALEGEGVIEFEGSIERMHGRAVQANMIVGPIVRDGRIEGTVAAFRDVTQERASREALRREQALLEELIGSIPIGVFLIDPTGRILHTNRAAREIWGDTPLVAGLADYGRYRAVDPSTGARIGAEDWAAARAVRTGRAVLGQDVLIETFGGQTKRILNSAVPLRDAHGRIARFVVLNIDITERAQAEVERAAVLDAALDAIVTIDGDGIVEAWNASAEGMFGYTRAEAIGRELAELIVPTRFRARHRAGIEHAVRMGPDRALGRRYHMPALRRDGTEFPTEISIVRVPGERPRFTGFVRDLSPERASAERGAQIDPDRAQTVARIEQRLRRRDEQHAAVASLGEAALQGRPLETLLEMAVRDLRRLLDVDYTKILQLDPDGETFTLRAGDGWRDDVVVGKTRVSAGLESQAGYALVKHAAVLVDDLPEETRFHPTPFLLEHGVRSGMSVVILGAHGPWGVLGVHTTRRRAFTEDDVNFLQSVANVVAYAIQQREALETLEQRVRDRTQELQQANRDLEAFTNTASHDLRAPLRGIGMLADDLETALQRGDVAEAAELAQHIRREDEKAIRLVRALLSFAQSGRQDVAHEDVDVTQLAREIGADILRRHPDRRTRFEIQDGIRARADPSLLRIALDNLLSNASKYSDRMPEPVVELTAETTERETILRVKDNGVGFPQDEAPRLFQAFHRLSTARGYEGTGLGLIAVHRVVARHGGRVWAESSVGRGATFYVALPR